METATMQITISDAAGEVFEVITMEMPRLDQMSRTDADVVSAIASDQDGDQCSIIDVIHDAALWIHNRQELAARKAAGDPPASPQLRDRVINNPAARFNLCRPKAGSVFVTLRRNGMGVGEWLITHETEGGEDRSQSFALQDVTGMQSYFSGWQIRTVRTSSTLDCPRDANVMIRAEDAHRILDLALAWG
jgi:hypothetical protein